LIRTLWIAEAMERTGRIRNEVCKRRRQLHIPDGRGCNSERKTRPWTWEEDKWVQTLSPAEVRERTGRTDKAVGARRRQLHVPDGRGRYSQPPKPPTADQVEAEKPNGKAKKKRKS
jgi:hypothetical protein